MRVSFRAVFAALLVAVATPLAAFGQQAAPQLATGTWTGVVVTPNGETTNVTYDVAIKNDTVSIMINAGEHGTFAAADIKLEPAKLSFSFVPGPTVQCVLNRKEDQSFDGTCTDDGGATATMTMVPPRKNGTGS